MGRAPLYVQGLQGPPNPHLLLLLDTYGTPRHNEKICALLGPLDLVAAVGYAMQLSGGQPTLERPKRASDPAGAARLFKAAPAK